MQILFNLSYVNKSFCKLLCSVFVAVNNLERFWVRQFFRCRCWAWLVWAQLDTQRFCRQFAVNEGIKQMVKMRTCTQDIKPKVWMIGAYGSSRTGEIAAGVNLIVLNPSSTKSSTWLSSKAKINIKQRNIPKNKRSQNEHASDLFTGETGSCLIFASCRRCASSFVESPSLCSCCTKWGLVNKRWNSGKNVNNTSL